MRHTNVHFSGPNDEDAHHNLSSDDNQVIQQENVCSEPPESLSYSLLQSHFQGSSTPQHSEGLPSQTYLGKALQRSTTNDY